MPLKIISGDIVFAPNQPESEGEVAPLAGEPCSQTESEPIVVISGKNKRCLAFGTMLAGLLVVLREGSSDGSLTNPISSSSRESRRKGDKGSRKGGKTAGGNPVSSSEKRTLSICSFDESTVSIQFLTHISVDGWSSLTVSPISTLVILSDYETAHSEVLEWQSASKTLRRVWEGRGSCPHIFNNGKDVLMLLYSARQFSLCSGRTMKEIDECSARSRDLDIVDVLACEEYAFVVYENNACSVFEVSESTVRRVIDLGKVLGGTKPTGVALVDDTACMIIYSDDHDEVCFLNPMSVGNKNSFEKSTDSKALFRKNIAFAEAQKANLGATAIEDLEEEDEVDNARSSKKSGKESGRKGKDRTEGKQKSNGSTDSSGRKGSAKSEQARRQQANAGEQVNDQSDNEGELSEGGIGIVQLLAISAVCMAATAAVVLRLASSKK